LLLATISQVSATSHGVAEINKPKGITLTKEVQL